MRIPIACSLDDSSARAQVDEWRDVLAAGVARVERSDPETVTMVLRPDLAGLRELAALAQREKACCPFFEFTFAIDADRVRFVVSVPADATAILDQFASLADPEAASDGRA